MNDGNNWREMRVWFVRSMKSIGFARKEMLEFLNDELILVLKQIGNGGIKRMKPIIEPVIINILWTFVTGKRFDEDR